MKAESGFTPIEQMAVVAIIALLSAIAVPMDMHGIRKTNGGEANDPIGALKDEIPRHFSGDGVDSMCSRGRAARWGDHRLAVEMRREEGEPANLPPNNGQTLLPRDKKCPWGARKKLTTPWRNTIRKEG